MGVFGKGRRPHLPACSHPGRPHLTGGGGRGPRGNGSWDRGGLSGLSDHLPRLRLPQGPAQGLRPLLEGAVALPREPELELDAGVGLLQEDLEGCRS